MRDRVTGTDVPVEYEETVSHDTRHAIVNHAERFDIDAILLERRGEQLHAGVFGSDIGWIKRHAPCDVLEIEDRGVDAVETVAVVSDQGPYDAIKVMLADALAVEWEGTVELLFPVDPSAPERQRETIQNYLDELMSQFDVSVSTRLVETADRAAGLTEAASDADLVIISAGTEGIKGALLGRPSDRIVEGIDRTAVVVYADGAQPGRIRRFLENQVF